MSRNRVVSVRFTEQERTELEAKADEVGVDLSELIRRGALATLYPAPALHGGTVSSSAPLVRIDPQ